MKNGFVNLSLILAAILFGGAGCRTGTISDNAPYGAEAILRQLEKRGEERTIALEGDIRGSANPPCSLMEAFLKARSRLSCAKVKLVERDLLNLIEDEHRFSLSDISDDQSLVRLGELINANTVVIGWGGENKHQIFETDSKTGEKKLEDEFWYTSYLHMIAIDIPTGCVIASWSFYPSTTRDIVCNVSPLVRKDDAVVVQPTLDDEVKSALLASLHMGSRDRYKVVVRDLARLLLREKERQSSDFFSRTSQNRLRISGATTIIGADSAMGRNLRAIDVRSGEIIGGLPGALSHHVRTSVDDPVCIFR